MDRIAELQELVAVAKDQRKKANKLRLRSMVQNINHDIRTWEDELVELGA